MPEHNFIKAWPLYSHPAARTAGWSPATARQHQQPRLTEARRTDGRAESTGGTPGESRTPGGPLLYLEEKTNHATTAGL